MAEPNAELRFDGLTAIVTGAARGLGAAHARLLAARGASVVVNDLAATGDANDGESADRVAAEIAQAGGNAVAVVGSVTDGEVRAGMVSAAAEQFGGVDIIVNNAGMGVPHAVGKLVPEHLRLEYEGHVVGALMLVDAAWSHLRERGGAVVLTSSGVGMFGPAGAIGYAAAKMALIGASNVIALEGAAHGIRCNAIAPFANTRMSGQVFGDLTPHLDPEHVAAAVAWLVHPSCELSGQVLSAGGTRVARAVTSVGRGRHADSPELVAGAWNDVKGDVQLEMRDAMHEADLARALLGIGDWAGD